MSNEMSFEPTFEGLRRDVANSAQELRALRSALNNITDAEIDEFKRCFTDGRPMSLLPQQLGIWAAERTQNYRNIKESEREELKQKKEKAWQCIVRQLSSGDFTVNLQTISAPKNPAPHLAKAKIEYLKSLDAKVSKEDRASREHFRSRFFQASADIDAEEEIETINAGGKMGIGIGAASVGVLLSGTALFIIAYTGTLTLASGLPGGIGLALFAFGLYCLFLAYQQQSQLNRQYSLSH